MSVGLPVSSPTVAESPWPGRLAWLVLAMAALVRAPHVIMPQLDADMAMWGVQALDIMQGRPHVLFSGELFGGNLEAWLAVPLFWLLGAGPAALTLVPTLLSLVMVWLVWRLGSRELGGWGGLAAMAWAGLAAMAWAGLAPYYLILQSVEPKGGYIEVPLFTVLAFALCLRLLRALKDDAPGAGLASMALGLVWGLGLWCHLLMLPSILACGLFLLLHQPRIILSRHPWLIALGLLAGGWPLWAISLPAGLFSGEVLREGREMQLGPAWNQLWAQGLPTVLGLIPANQVPWHGLWHSWRLVLWAAYGLACAGLLWDLRRQIFSRQLSQGDLPRLCLLFVAVYMAVWLFSGAYSQGTWRHLSPLYAALPFIFGAAVELLSRRRPRVALAAVSLLLGLHLLGAWQMTPLLRPGEWDNFREHRRQEQERFAYLKRERHQHVYAQWFWDAVPLTLAARGQITFADQVENHLPELTRLADADPRPAYVFTTRAEDMSKGLIQAGIAFRSSNIGRFTVFDNFSRPGPVLREVAPQAWQSPTPGAGDTWDRNLSTRWTLAMPQQPGQRLVLDLGRVEQDVCQVALMPGLMTDAAQSLQLRLSEDGQNWRRAVKGHKGTLYPVCWSLDRPLMPFQPASMVLRFTPQTARYLELTQEGLSPSRWWSVAEVLIHQAAGEQAPAVGSPSPEACFVCRR